MLLKLDTMNLRERIAFLTLFSIGTFLTLAFGVWWFSSSHIPHNFTGIPHILDLVLFIVLSYIVWHPLVMELFSWYNLSYIRHPNGCPVPKAGMRVAYATAFVPASEPYDILEKTLNAMVQVEYPHDTWLLDEGDDQVAREICERLGVRHYSRYGKEEFNTNSGKFAKKTKGGNYNSWLHHYDKEYDIVAQHDVDFVPRKDFLLRTLGYFNDPKVAFVGTPQIYGNAHESWITKAAAEQTYGFYGPLQKGFYGHDMTLLIGANHLFRTSAYRDIGGYSAHIVEDMLTGMKLYSQGREWRSVYVPEVLLVGEGPKTWESYFNQQMRWSYGCMDIVFRHAPHLLPKMKTLQIINFVLLQQFYFSGVAQVLGVCLLVLYFFLGITPASMALLPIFILYVPLILYQNLFQLWIQRFNIVPKEESGLYLRGKLLSISAWPIYFVAFLGAIRGKKLTYVVTPKGTWHTKKYATSYFIPHFILGTCTFVGIIVGLTFSHHVAVAMLFWAVLNTLFMYGFFFSEAIPEITYKISNSKYTKKYAITKFKDLLYPSL